jgi:hypothetical protein
MRLRSVLYSFSIAFFGCGTQVIVFSSDDTASRDAAEVGAPRATEGGVEAAAGLDAALESGALADAGRPPLVTCRPGEEPLLLGTLEIFPSRLSSDSSIELRLLDVQTGEHSAFLGSTASELASLDHSGGIELAVDNEAHRLYLIARGSALHQIVTIDT